MKYNYLDRLPPDIGRMSQLEYLALTNNKLQNKALPFTLTFCQRLHTLMLDNNLLDALPGFLLTMDSLKTVHRHGNHNYFKSTFMWYHTDVNERILAVSGVNGARVLEPRTLQFWAAKAILGMKMDFFSNPSVAPPLKDYIAEIYSDFNICGHCNTGKLISQPGEAHTCQGYPGYFQESLGKSVGLSEVSGVACQVWRQSASGGEIKATCIMGLLVHNIIKILREFFLL